MVQRSSERLQSQLQEPEQRQQGFRNGFGRGHTMNNHISYEGLYSMGNLTLAWRKARERKTLHSSIIEFEKELERNLLSLHTELKKKPMFQDHCVRSFYAIQRRARLASLISGTEWYTMLLSRLLVRHFRKRLCMIHAPIKSERAPPLLYSDLTDS